MLSTPMMKQWKDLKDRAKDALLLFRLGDFYEAFHEDSYIISKELDLTLTKRQNVAMCGVPYHASEIYIDRLISKGFKVAIAEQMENPQNVKGLVKRDIARILSPGVIFNSNLLQAKSNNFFISLSQISTTFGIAIIDLSTCEFSAMEIENEKDLINEIYKLKPSEILISRKFKSQNENLLEKLTIDLNFLINEKDEWYFDFELAHTKLINQFNLSNLDSFGLKGMNSAIIAAGALIGYLTEDLSLNLNHIKSIKKENLSSYMAIDYSTMKNLEIIDSNNFYNKENTLINLLDKTSTAMGGRLLKNWLKYPLLEIEKINERQNSIKEILDNFEVFLNIRSNLENIKDLQRLLIRIINQSSTPRDLSSLRFSIKVIPSIKELLNDFKSNLILKIKENLKDITPLLNLLDESLVEQPPIRLSDGNIFKEGYNNKLDELKGTSKNSFSWLNNYQEELKTKTSIKTLKIKYNKVFGYFIEVSKAQSDKVPADFFRKQTLVNSERYINEKLKEFEHKVLSSEDQIKFLENSLFLELREKVLKYSNEVEKISEAIAELDTLLSLALVAKNYRYVKPEINNSSIIDIKNGRHPTIEAFLSTGEFIPNDSFLDNQNNQLLLITGPNMAGKSTYIRQVALIVIMAQIGSYIPAESATIGIVDKVFSRIGASDDISRGQSTFMVEMTETANILNNATNRSLIILDEIGRGTSTYDGISIAWAVADYLLTCENKKAKTLFATHYFELTELEKDHPGVVNYNVEVKETDSDIVFLRKIIVGSTDRSYGIHVARLANMPHSVIKKAQERLINLEKNQSLHNKKPKNEQLTFINLNEKLNKKFEKIIDEIKDIDLNNLTPLQALEKIFYLKQKIEK
jgi:DNA mismatch repair protein MutS